jgi:8-oxo-dGTP pyrophosphatase MutT (NUDIX family)
MAMIYLERPKLFSPVFEAVSCFFEVDGHILLLLRNHVKRIEPSKWGVPAGAMEKGEGRRQAMARELFEETGQHVHPRDFEVLPTVYVKYPNDDFLYHMYRLRLSRRPHIALSSEHQAFVWANPLTALYMDLMQDEGACIKMVYGL